MYHYFMHIRENAVYLWIKKNSLMSTVVVSKLFIHDVGPNQTKINSYRHEMIRHLQTLTAAVTFHVKYEELPNTRWCYSQNDHVVQNWQWCKGLRNSIYVTRTVWDWSWFSLLAAVSSSTWSLISLQWDVQGAKTKYILLIKHLTTETHLIRTGWSPQVQVGLTKRHKNLNSFTHYWWRQTWC